ncbi:uracil-DNA glycosylase [Deferribacter desulfuricans SSM1]|uniref:Type-4 uracil-DNA glycosylase n=1 Tax=Deferribacter desulfuricans (strain DSM 14783 / JCM 11476 / NBRC 101012 / SSM1) TaxID=639282 RepID=D3PE62_DEFDS|nr:uracil-DNA glycosylase [Deferribacter desulfuricans]BAI80885.1 uracil-DNA glycosylase [Deferribacter desulfuricans SSM1]
MSEKYLKEVFGIEEVLIKSDVKCNNELYDFYLNEVKDCNKCRLAKNRTNLVFGEGDPNAELMFVGEGPGAEEDKQGRPFVGRAGQLLTKMIEAMKLKREDVYIANIVKCRPPNNRAPLNDEIGACIPYLHKQIEIIKPKYIICLGSIAASALLNTTTAISKIRGSFREFKGIKVMPTFHPAYLLRNPKMKKLAWEDLQLVMKEMGLL